MARAKNKIQNSIPNTIPKKSVKVSTKEKWTCAIYPGSFDPITIGHIDIIQRMAPHFDEFIVLISKSSQKSEMFTIEERINLIRKSLGSSKSKNIKVEAHDGLTVDFARKNNANVIVRGLRAIVDFEYEISMANMNRKLAPEIETILAFASPEYFFISSRGVKEIANHKGKLDGLVPEHVIKALEGKLR